MTKRLSQIEITKGLESLGDWTQEGEAIKRVVKFESFMKAIDFINRVAALAEEADHHPELFNVYDKVEIVLTTHDAKGLTAKDFDLAEKIDRAV
jgi:4a-hydroxytetrahydrobiopterin dehydratase